MTDAINNPVKRQYTRKEIDSRDTPMEQLADIDLGLDKQIIHGEGIANILDPEKTEHMKLLDFNEEPVELIIDNTNSQSDFPETAVPVQVNGRGAEVLHNGRWMEMTWLPIGIVLTVKRKYVEVLARSKSIVYKTVHDDATVEKPRNNVRPSQSQNYPISVTHDANPNGARWLADLTRAQ